MERAYELSLESKCEHKNRPDQLFYYLNHRYLSKPEFIAK